jgi:hypothetical protein
MFPIELGLWHALLLATLFGFCAIWNRAKGWQRGAVQTLENLERKNIIIIQDSPPLIKPGTGIMKPK